MKNNLVPVIIHDKNKMKYFNGLQDNNIGSLTTYLEREQEMYFKSMRDFLHVLERNKSHDRENVPEL